LFRINPHLVYISACPAFPSLSCYFICLLSSLITSHCLKPITRTHRISLTSQTHIKLITRTVRFEKCNPFRNRDSSQTSSWHLRILNATSSH
jgi:hypothetical protein